MPVPLSWICRSLSPPSFTVTWMVVDLASRLQRFTHWSVWIALIAVFNHVYFNTVLVLCNRCWKAALHWWLAVFVFSVLIFRTSTTHLLASKWTLPHSQLVNYQFSISSLTALAGRWITSPAAMRLTTVSSSLRITPAMFTVLLAPCNSLTTSKNYE